MKYMKWFFCLLTVVLLSLVLLAGCASPDNPDSPDGDLDDTDLVIECDYGGEIARNREMIPILVRHDQEAIYLYYSDDFFDGEEEYRLLDKAELPTDELHDTDWDVEWVDVNNFAGDYNGDLRITLRHADYSMSYIAWIWEKDKGYVYQPDDSWFYNARISDLTIKSHVAVEGRWGSDTDGDCIWFDAEGNWKLYSINADSGVVEVADEGYLSSEPEEDVSYLYSNVGGDLDCSCIELSGDGLYISGEVFFYDRFAQYEGLWRCERNGRWYYLQFDTSGNWQLWIGGEVVDEGHLWYSEEQGEAIYISSTLGRFLDGGGIGADSDHLTIGAYSDLDLCFDYVDGRGGYWQGASGSNWTDEYREDIELFYRDFSELEGTWYYENYYWSTDYIVIDGNGNWSYYECVDSSDPKGTETDHGTFSRSSDGNAVYYAESDVYDGVSFWVCDLDEDILIWNDTRAYYRIDW